MSTLPSVELGVLGPLQVRQDGVPVSIPGAKPRAILTMLGLHSGSVLSADAIATLLWGENPPRTAAKALQTHISALRRTLGDGIVLTEGGGWTLAGAEVDASRYKLSAKMGRDAAAAGDSTQAVVRFDEALNRWRGVPELPDSQRGVSEKTRWIEGHAALVEDRADALLATGRAAEIVGELESAVAEAPLRERRWCQLMLALYRAGRQGEALGAYQRARSLLADELGVDPGPDLRRLEAAIVSQDTALDTPVVQHLSSVTRTVTFLLTDIEGSTAAWESDAGAMAVALARHDELAEQVVTSRGGRLIKTRGEGDATFSVFERPSAAAAAAIELQDAITHEPWALLQPMRIRIALHTGEVEFRDGDYFGRAVNRAARLRSLAEGGQILCSGATAELVVDSLRDDAMLVDLGTRQLRNLTRPEHVFELRRQTDDDAPAAPPTDEPLDRPGLATVLTGAGPFVGRGHELARLMSTWQTAVSSGTHAVLIAGEPGVGKTRLAGEWCRQVYEQGAMVLYGRCDEDLGAPYQPFAEALRALVPCLGAARLRGLRGVEALLALAPGLADLLPDLAAPTRADPDTERYALFDAVVALFGVASAHAPVVLILDDLHWAAKSTLLLMRHLLRFGEHARVQIVGTYRSTDLDRSHPLAATLADLHRDGSANRLQLGGLDEHDVTTYVTEAGYDDEELARALASVTGGNPFFLIEALRHVDESGGRWDPNTLPQGVREAVSRRLSRLTSETNKALSAAAVVGSRFALDLVERVVDQDLVDAFDEACKAGVVVEEPGGRYRFNHALVRQSLLAEMPSVRRMRLHQRIATTLEHGPGGDGELIAELAYHYYECAWAGNAVKAADYCHRAADQAMARLAYEGAADLYDRALQALEGIDDELPDRDQQAAELMVARCEALLAAGDVTSAAHAVAQLQETTVDSTRLAAWATCFDGQLSMLTHPERLDEIEAAVNAAAAQLAELHDAAGEAKAHTVRAGCLARLGRIGDCEIALDAALAAARRGREHRQVNAVLAGAPIAALWGPNPVPRAGGRCLDVVRLLRITTDSPAVEATSTRCQAVLEAFRGRAPAARRMIDTARRTVTEVGLRHARLEIELFAGIVELVADDPGAAEAHLRQAYNGFRRMGLDADTAEAAALLGRACLALDRDAEADELCRQSELLAGHALKASIAWRALRAQLLSRGNDHDEARRVAEAAVSLAERTDALVDHGDACLALAGVLESSGIAAGARAAAERAVGLYERKGAVALAEKARRLLGGRVLTAAPIPTEVPPPVVFDNACGRVVDRLAAACNTEAWDDVERLYSPTFTIESRRKIVGFTRDPSAGGWPQELKRVSREVGPIHYRHRIVAIRGEHLALVRLEMTTADVSPGAPREEMLHLTVLDEAGLIARAVWFDVDDMDAALVELDAVHERLARANSVPLQLENPASRLIEHNHLHFLAGDWDAIAETIAVEFSHEDRRRVVNAGIRYGRENALEDLRANANLGVRRATSAVIATRGDRLVLRRTRYSAGSQGEPFFNDVLNVVEIDAYGRFAALVSFDLEDFDAALTELDARYIAGEAADHAHTWEVIIGTYASINRRELPALTPDCATEDHRRLAAFPPGELTAYIHAGWDPNQDRRRYVEVVHRLSDLGAVCTYAAQGVSPEGFDAEWQEIAVTTVQGDMVNRCELYNVEDLEIALAKFEELQPRTQRLENTASQVVQRLCGYFAARDWDAIAELVAENVCTDDRRRTANAELRHGRAAEVEDLRAAADVGFANLMPTVIANRGQRLMLSRTQVLGHDPEAIRIDLLHLVEIDADERIVGIVVFELDDVDAALRELDRRYVAGEAAPYARTMHCAMDILAEVNRHETGPMTGELAFTDHRRVPFASGDFGRAVAELWQLVPTARYRVTTVHALDVHGTVADLVIEGIDGHGNELQWARTILLDPNESRMEVYDDGDLDAALARFEQLRRPVLRLQNAATRQYERFLNYFTARDWDSFAKSMSVDIYRDDRRRAVSAAASRGRDAAMVEARGVADIGAEKTVFSVVAIRGEHLALVRSRFCGLDQRPEAFHTEFLCVIEVDDDGSMGRHVMFDSGGLGAALAELDELYLAGEAGPHAHVWSTITQAYGTLNRGEIPTTVHDFVDIDHRHVAVVGDGDLKAYLRAALSETSHNPIYVEAVHRLSDFGAVVTHVASGTSQDGFDAEWRITDIFMVDGDLLSRCEMFDEAHLDDALARFEELHPKAQRLENAASRMAQRFRVSLESRDWDAMTEMMSEDVSNDDRRRVVNAGVLRGRDATIADLRASVGVMGIIYTSSVAIATRGERLVLIQAHLGNNERPGDVQFEVLQIYEIDAEGWIAGVATFDGEDLDAAFTELDTRYLAGEAAPHSPTWSAVAGSYAAINRADLPEAKQDWVLVDHRLRATIEAGDLTAYLRENWKLTPDFRTRIEVVHRLTDLGAIVTQASHGKTQHGMDAEWRDLAIVTVNGGRVDRCELFNESEMDAALARFEELDSPAPPAENAATQAWIRAAEMFNRRDLDGFIALADTDGTYEDRRKGLRNTIKGQARRQVAHALFETLPDNWKLEVQPIAVRGSSLSLIRESYRDTDDAAGQVAIETCRVTEVDDSGLIHDTVTFDPEDLDDAFAELDARWSASQT